jgi:hypothetical protein
LFVQTLIHRLLVEGIWKDLILGRYSWYENAVSWCKYTG